MPLADRGHHYSPQELPLVLKKVAGSFVCAALSSVFGTFLNYMHYIHFSNILFAFVSQEIIQLIGSQFDRLVFE